MDERAMTRDPWDFLMNAGSDPGLWLLLGGPLLLLVILALVLSVVFWSRRKRELADLKAAVEQAEDPNIIPLPMTARDARDDVTSGKPYEIPSDLRGEEPSRAAPLSLVKPAPAKPLTDVEEIRRTDRDSWRQRLFSGLTKSRDALRSSLQGIFGLTTRLDGGTLEQLHEALYRADIGVATAEKLVQHVKSTVSSEDAASWEVIARQIKEKAALLMAPAQGGDIPWPETGPLVILVVGVNGVGKTTSIGKLAAHFLACDKKVLLAAADTFRAAAIEQLSVWGERLGVDVIKHQAGSDPAAVAYDAVQAAKARGADVLLIDTAGRLHAKAELMAELGKISRIVGRDLPGAPHETWLVIDATTGQNAVQQVKAFKEVTTLSGLLVTKLDGTAKGGVLIGITDQFGLPIRYIGVGEKAADLRDFVVEDFVQSLF